MSNYQINKQGRLFTELDQLDPTRSLHGQKPGINQYRWLAPLMRKFGDVLNVPVGNEGKVITVSKESAQKFFNRNVDTKFSISDPVKHQQLQNVAKALFHREIEEFKKELSSSKGIDKVFFEKLIEQLQTFNTPEKNSIQERKLFQQFRQMYKTGKLEILQQIPQDKADSIGNIVSDVINHTDLTNEGLSQRIEDIVSGVINHTDSTSMLELELGNLLNELKEPQWLGDVRTKLSEKKGGLGLTTKQLTTEQGTVSNEITALKEKIDQWKEFKKGITKIKEKLQSNEISAENIEDITTAIKACQNATTSKEFIINYRNLELKMQRLEEGKL